MNDIIENEEEFQKEISKLQTILATEGATIMKLYDFVRNDNSYRTDTVELVDESVNEALRQIGFLDTYNGEEEIENDNEDDYVNFGDVSRGRLGIQCQYGSQYVDGGCGRVCLGDGLRFKGNTNHYHSLKIHKDDVEKFVKRYEWYQKRIAAI